MFIGPRRSPLAISALDALVRVLARSRARANAFCSVVLLVFLTPAGAYAQARVGLVIGVSEYTTGSRLDQVPIDAGAIHEALVDVGFDMQPMLMSPSKNQLQTALLEFSRRARGADVAMLYFAGHGMQYAEDNWIIPSDATLRHEDEIVLEGVSMQNLVRIMSQAKMRILILDACRNNPFAVNWIVKRANSDGLAGVPDLQLPLGTLVGYSAAAGQKTPDNGAYAAALSAAIRQEGVELRQTMDRVRRQVRSVTPDAEPEYIPRYEGSFSFRPSTVYAGSAESKTPETLQKIVVTNALTRSGVALIKDMESYEPLPYDDEYGHCTIGYGHLISRATCAETSLGEFADGIDGATAHNLLLLDLESVVEGVRNTVKSPLSQGQFNALVSFAFNVGLERFQRSTLLMKVNEGDHEAAAAQFDRWTRAGGKEMPGLIVRRSKERALFEADLPVAPQ